MRAKRSAAAPLASARSSAPAGIGRPASASSSAASASVTSRSRGSARAPGQQVDRFLHLERVAGGAPRHWLMSVSSAAQRSPAPLATPTMLRRRARARPSSEGRNAPEPTLTSITSASSPAASFFERIEAVISGIDSTVAVTSRIA